MPISIGSQNSAPPRPIRPPSKPTVAPATNAARPTGGAASYRGNVPQLLWHPPISRDNGSQRPPRS